MKPVEKRFEANRIQLYNGSDHRLIAGYFRAANEFTAGVFQSRTVSRPDETPLSLIESFLRACIDRGSLVARHSS